MHLIHTIIYVCIKILFLGGGHLSQTKQQQTESSISFTENNDL